MARGLILYPLVGFFILVHLVGLRLLLARMTLIQSKKVTWNFFKVFRGGEESEKSLAVSRNFTNLFEMPLLFYVIIILIYFTARLNNSDVPPTQVMLAWFYVGLRTLHSTVHLTFNHVPTRFGLFALSNLILILMWIHYFTVTLVVHA